MRLVGLISRIFLLIAACSADQEDLSANQTAFFRSDDKLVKHALGRLSSRKTLALAQAKALYKCPPPQTPPPCVGSRTL